MTPPHDITWTRFAFSRDMIDTNFGDLKFPPKWRSSLAVYYYIVPEEETADAYPNSRIVYLRLTCSITGWNPNEEIIGFLSERANDNLDDLQKSIYETIKAAGFASEYLPCYGAIMQVGIYPNLSNPPENVSVDDYPEIMDFEPKKRELYEAVTEGSEILEESSNKLSTTKGDTTIDTTTKSGSAGLSIKGVFSAGGSYTKNSEHQIVDSNVTDVSRQDRETKSHSTSFSQMYQLFNGYHLGTNRALFVVAPRPHIASNADETQFNLIAGERKLEGIQDVFLVVNVPRNLGGFCIQASIDTGHKKPQYSIASQMRKKKDGPYGGTDGGGTNSPDTNEQGEPEYRFIVTRRLVQNCGKFDENGNFIISGVPDISLSRLSRNVNIVWEESLPSIVSTQTVSKLMQSDQPMDLVRKAKVDLVNKLNISQSMFMDSMVRGFSAGNFDPIPFSKSRTFNLEVQQSLQNLEYPISKMVELGYLTQDDARILNRLKIMTAGAIFKNDLGQSSNPDILKLRETILQKFGI